MSGPLIHSTASFLRLESRHFLHPVIYLHSRSFYCFMQLKNFSTVYIYTLSNFPLGPYVKKGLTLANMQYCGGNPSSWSLILLLQNWARFHASHFRKVSRWSNPLNRSTYFSQYMFFNEINLRKNEAIKTPLSLDWPASYRTLYCTVHETYTLLKSAKLLYERNVFFKNKPLLLRSFKKHLARHLLLMGNFGRQMSMAEVLFITSI